MHATVWAPSSGYKLELGFQGVLKIGLVMVMCSACSGPPVLQMGEVWVWFWGESSVRAFSGKHRCSRVAPDSARSEVSLSQEMQLLKNHPFTRFGILYGCSETENIPTICIWWSHGIWSQPGPHGYWGEMLLLLTQLICLGAFWAACTLGEGRHRLSMHSWG